MRISILGFSQQGLLDLGLDEVDAQLLRWFIDFTATGGMKSYIADQGEPYRWVSHKKVEEDLPILGLSARATGTRFKKLCDTGVLDRAVIPGYAGKMSCYRLNATVVDSLLSTKKAMSMENDMGAQTDMHVNENIHAMSMENDMPCQSKMTCNNSSSTDSSFTDIKDTLVQIGIPDKGRTEFGMEPESDKKPEKELFDQFWMVYPRREKKQDALRAWNRITGMRTLFPKIISSVEDHKHTEQWRNDHGRFIPLPASWLNGGCWDDEIRKDPATPALTRPDLPNNGICPDCGAPLTPDAVCIHCHSIAINGTDGVCRMEPLADPSRISSIVSMLGRKNDL